MPPTQPTRAADASAARAARVLLVDDHPLTRGGLRLLLADQAGLSVCGEAGTLEEARRVAAQSLPDLILLDLQLPDGSGLNLLEEVRRRDDPPAVLVLSGVDEAGPEVVEAFRLGAAGFVGKPTSGDGVLAAVRGALAGRPQIPNGLIDRLIRRQGYGGS